MSSPSQCQQRAKVTRWTISCAPPARLVYESMAARPEALYGADLKSNYQGQALKLSKHFKG